MDIVKAKIQQATRLLEEMNIDAWALFERETAMQKDPTHDMVVGLDAVWSSLFLFTRRGDAIALVGNFDADGFIRSGRFTKVQSYVKGAGDDVRKILEEVNPRTLALNYSIDDCASDGLTHGMFLLLRSYFDGTPYAERIIPAQPFISKLRSRKLPEEVARLERATVMATQVWDRVRGRIEVGMSEKQIAGVIESDIRHAGGTPSFETIVNAGTKTNPGHGHPTDAILESGDLLHVDFGVRIDGYCSDIQRLLYFHRPGKSSVPVELSMAFQMVKSVIDEAAKTARPGVKGLKVDALARRMLRDGGYPEYDHALGHQLGRDVHDGGALLGPQWERYGKTPLIPIEAGNVFTLELGIMLPGIGYVGLEEDVVIEPGGTRFLSVRQTDLLVK